MIYSASRRTDLPAFYPDFICKKVERSRKLEAIVFWTKDPRNFLLHRGLQFLVRRVPSIVQLTLTGLGSTHWEPCVPEPAALRDGLQFLARELPPGAVRWRFDPILASPDLISRFQAMHELLLKCGLSIEEVTVSFPDLYPHAVRRMAAQGVAFQQLGCSVRQEILGKLIECSGLRLALCCEAEHLNLPGVFAARCVDGALLDRLYGTNLGSLEKDAGQRKACGCCRSVDIGSYDQPCRHGCIYCYANRQSGSGRCTQNSENTC